MDGWMKDGQAKFWMDSTGCLEDRESHLGWVVRKRGMRELK